MSLETAVSVGMGLIKHRQELGAALGGVAGLSKLNGAGFEKIAQRFHLPKGLTGQISRALAENADPNNTNGIELLSAMRFFDADHNGQITQDELKQGLQQLSASGMGANSAQGSRLKQVGEQLLQNYAKVAQLDGQSEAISYQDAGKLLNQDGKPAMLTAADWQKLNA